MPAKDISKCISLAAINYYDSAIDCFSQFVPGDKDYLAAVYGLATCYLFKKDYEHAEASYAIYLSYNPKHNIAWYYLGVMRFYLKRYKDSITALERAKAINPEYPHTYLMLLINNLFLQNEEEAAANFKTAIQKSPRAVSVFLSTFEEVIIKPSSLSDEKKAEIYKRLEAIKKLLGTVPTKA